MRKIKIERKKIELIKSRKKENDILKLLDVDDSGMIVYPGRGSILERTGSPVMALIDWHLYKIGEKPIDYDIFANHLKQLGV
jgi:hypothetical protein